MQLKKIEILKYKSINTPAIIDIEKGKVITLIGKNGSGKTNILKALKQAFSRNHSMRDFDYSMSINYCLQLTQNERKKFFKGIDLRKEDGLIKVHSNGREEPQYYFYAKPVRLKTQQFRDEAEEISAQFKAAKREYIDTLTNLVKTLNPKTLYTSQIYLKAESGDECDDFKYLDIDVERADKNLTKQIKDIEKIADTFKDGEFTLDDYNFPELEYSFRPIIIPHIKAQTICVDNHLANLLQLTPERIQKATFKLNETLKIIDNALDNSRQKLQELWDKANKLTKDIYDFFRQEDDKRYAAKEKKEKAYTSFIEKLKDAASINCYFLDNENTLLFHSPIRDDYYGNSATYENFHSYNPIMSTFHNFLTNSGAYKKDESILEYSKLEPNRKEQLIELINSRFLDKSLPTFEKGEINGIKLKAVDNQLKLYIVENSGDETDVNYTSLGRRWYLTYLIIKSILKSGDILLIDEPAAFLHPQAQHEIKQDLEQLAESGIIVIYATHSPYIIPGDWGQVYNVRSTSVGTQVSRFFSDDELSTAIKEELGITRNANILFYLDKTLLLVEGTADKACIEKFAELLEYDISKYHIHVCDGDAILQVAYICLKLDIEKVYIILDNDNNYKPETFKSTHPMYQECMNEIKKHPEKCIFIGDTENGSIESYFKDNNNKFKRNDKRKKQLKIDVKAINAITQKDEVCSETLNNFEQLFIQLGMPKLNKNN